MTKEEFDLYVQSRETIPAIRASDLVNQSDRTLMFGYNVARETIHVYLQGGEIYYHKYTGWPTFVTVYYEHKSVWAASDLHPGKRAYPERTDFEFAALMKARDAALPFTTYPAHATPPELDRNGYYGALVP